MSPPSLHTNDWTKKLRILQCQTRTAGTAVSHARPQDVESIAAAGRDLPNLLIRGFRCLYLRTACINLCWGSVA